MLFFHEINPSRESPTCQAQLSAALQGRHRCQVASGTETPQDEPRPRAAAEGHNAMVFIEYIYIWYTTGELI